MPPVHKPLKNDGPACRCCGCTENNACVDYRLGPTHFRSKVMVPRTYYGCSWVKVEGATEPLCSACSGTDTDLAEAIQRIIRMLEGTSAMDFSIVVGRAALLRRKRRMKAQKGA